MDKYITEAAIQAAVDARAANRGEIEDVLAAALPHIEPLIRAERGCTHTEVKKPKQYLSGVINIFDGRVERVRELHSRSTRHDMNDLCAGCGDYYPCPTIRALVGTTAGLPVS